MLFSQNPSSWQYLPVRIQGVCRSGPKCLAVFTDLDARCLSIRNKIPGNICQCKCEAFLWSEPKPLAIFRRLNARRFSARTKIPGDIYQIECAAFSARTAIAGETSQSKCGAFVGQDRNSWRYLPICLRGVFRSYPKCLAVFSDLGAMCVSVRTEILGGFSQFKCEALFRESRRFWRYFPV